MSPVIDDVSTSVPAYQRRLTAGGFLSRYRLSRDVTNLTGAGLALADNVTGALLRRVRKCWPTDVVAHPAITTDRNYRRFAAATSPGFDAYRIGEAGWLVFDCNYAHLDWLRARLSTRAGPLAVATTSGIYRPVASTQNLIRDEFISPFFGMHVAVPRDDVAPAWANLSSVVASLADAVGVPLLLARCPPPDYYARSCLAALLPAPSGRLEPWMLAYELGDRFHSYLGRPDTTILELGVSGRVLAFAAQLQRGRAAAFGSEVIPTQLFTTAAGPALRAAPQPGAGDRTLRLTGLALVDHDPDSDVYRSLVDDYEVGYTWPGSAEAALDAEDRRLRAANAGLLADAVQARYTVTRTRPGHHELPVITHAPDPSWIGSHLVPTDRPARHDAAGS